MSSCVYINKYLSWFLNFQNAPLMRCRQCHFPSGLGENILENQHFLVIYLQYWIFFAVLVVSYWSIILTQMYFSKLLRPFEDNRKTITFVAGSNMPCLFIEVFWNIGAALFIIVFESKTAILKTSSNHMFYLTAWKIAIQAAQRRQVQKPARFFIYYLDLEVSFFFLSNYLNSRDPVPLGSHQNLPIFVYITFHVSLCNTVPLESCQNRFEIATCISFAHLMIVWYLECLRLCGI